LERKALFLDAPLNLLTILLAPLHYYFYHYNSENRLSDPYGNRAYNHQLQRENGYRISLAGTLSNFLLVYTVGFPLRLPSLLYRVHRNQSQQLSILYIAFIQSLSTKIGSATSSSQDDCGYITAQSSDISVVSFISQCLYLLVLPISYPLWELFYGIPYENWELFVERSLLKNQIVECMEMYSDNYYEVDEENEEVDMNDLKSINNFHNSYFDYISVIIGWFTCWFDNAAANKKKNQENNMKSTAVTTENETKSAPLTLETVRNHNNNLSSLPNSKVQSVVGMPPLADDSGTHMRGNLNNDRSHFKYNKSLSRNLYYQQSESTMRGYHDTTSMTSSIQLIRGKLPVKNRPYGVHHHNHHFYYKDRKKYWNCNGSSLFPGGCQQEPIYVGYIRDGNRFTCDLCNLQICQVCLNYHLLPEPQKIFNDEDIVNLLEPLAASNVDIIQDDLQSIVSPVSESPTHPSPSPVIHTDEEIINNNENANPIIEKTDSQQNQLIVENLRSELQQLRTEFKQFESLLVSKLDALSKQMNRESNLNHHQQVKDHWF
jgi:hypothetical protein